MEIHEQKIPNYVFEDMLFRRRLQRNLNDELERLNNLLAEQVRLLETRKQLMTDASESVEQRWKAEEQATSDLNSIPATEKVGDAD